jgi:S-formylglutathione hydrolase FrmB
MSRTIIFAAVVLSLFPGVGKGQTVLRWDSLFSPSLGRTTRIAVLLPPGYDSQRAYPVLYLLHGLTGSYRDWPTRTRISRHAECCSLLIVMPDAGNSWYLNSATDSTARFEDLIVTDIPAYIEGHYRVSGPKAAIAGLSMGGFGAAILGMRHPDKYLFVGSLSGALSVVEELREGGSKDSSPLAVRTVQDAFGVSPNPAWDRYDPLLAYRRTRAQDLPFFYFVHGIQDGKKLFLPAHRRLTDSLRVYGAAYEYHEVPGKHNWELWDREIVSLLHRLKGILSPDATQRPDVH